jgi:N-acetylneuraminate synthase
MNDIRIGQHLLGPAHRPFVIAEMSGNHNQSLERALALVDAAAKAGAHALKLQTYTADTMTLDLDQGEFRIQDDKSLWQGQTLYGLYRQAHTPWEWHAPIFRRCRELGLLAFSSPFDATAVDFLESLDVPCFKIASFEIVDLPLIRKAASTGRPLIISTGMATTGEIEQAVCAAREAGCPDLVLLKCTSNYPAALEDSHLATIPHMRELFGCHVGLSDHTPGIGAALAAAAFGAVAIEKHFTLRRAEGGVDSAFSLEPEELALLVQQSEAAWKAVGGIHYGPTAAEKGSLMFRRSLYVAQDMRAGERFDSKNLRSIRPGAGLPPQFYEMLLGKPVTRDVEKGTPVTWSLIG